MTIETFRLYRATDLGGSTGLEFAGLVTVRDDDGFRDTTFDDIESAGSSEWNGDQEVDATTVAELTDGDTIRTRGLYRFTNNDTGETFDNVIEVYSQSAAFPTVTLFLFTAEPPAWLFDSTTNRTLSLLNSDGTIPYSSIVCFGEGTLIKGADGQEIAVEDLAVGDLIATRNAEYHPLRWIGSVTVTKPDLTRQPKLRPIRIAPGTLGKGLPTRDLLVSPQHRILVRSRIAQRMFGSPEILIPAVKLLCIPGVEVASDVTEMTYYHLLFDAHQLITSNGALTESLFTGPQALSSVSPEARAEIETLFPQICADTYAPTPAVLIPDSGRKMRKLAERHAKNQMPLVETV